jgi:hypothetical protein
VPQAIQVDLQKQLLMPSSAILFLQSLTKQVVNLKAWVFIEQKGYQYYAFNLKFCRNKRKPLENETENKAS